MGAAVARGVGDSGIHGDIAQPHAGHLGVVHCLDEHGLQALQHLHHLCPLHGLARLMDPVLLSADKGVYVCVGGYALAPALTVPPPAPPLRA